MDTGNRKSVEYPDTDEIEPEAAKFLFEQHCAILVLEDLPVGSEFGIDMITYQVGEKFKGVKLIPPGVHLIYASAVSSKDQRQFGPRCGFFHDFKTKELLVKRWSTSEEDFDDSFLPDEGYRERYSSNLRDLDRYLGPYRFSTYNAFLGLTDKITPDLVQLLMPECGRLRSVPFLVKKESVSISEPRARRFVQSGSTRPTEETLLPDLVPDETTVIKFTDIPESHLASKQKIKTQDITYYNLDTTMKLNHTFGDQSSLHRLLGEFQFAFVTLIFCHIYDCLEHWKKILALVCRAEKALERDPEFFVHFLKILFRQLELVPEDLFEDIVESNNLVRCYLDNMKRNIDDYNQAPEILRSEFQRLETLVQTRFSWRFDLESDDEKPVVVEL